jgi:hypothetical protein
MEHAPILPDEPLDRLLQPDFPMYVIRIKEFMMMESWVSHEELKMQQKLEQFDRRVHKSAFAAWLHLLCCFVLLTVLTGCAQCSYSALTNGRRVGIRKSPTGRGQASHSHG